jgi:hypothetical protein
MPDRCNWFLSGARRLPAVPLLIGALGLGLVAESMSAAEPPDPLSEVLPLEGVAPRLEIELPEKDVAALRSEIARRSALGGRLGESQEGARLRPRGHARGGEGRVGVRVELLDDWSERLEGGRWPLALNVRGADTLYGFDRFALRAPAIRGYHAEMLMLEHLRREGILAPEVFFVRASLNGQDLGLMKLHQDLGKDMVENQERRDGAILHFEDSGSDLASTPGLTRAPDAFIARSLVFERPSRAKKSEVQAADRILAVQLLDGFLAGVVPARQVFDIDLMARFLAVCEVWRAVDTVRWPNLRFYFNPVTKRLEPIGHAASPPAIFLEDRPITVSEAWPKALLKDVELREAFQRNLARIVEETLTGETEAWLREEEGPHLRLLDSAHRTQAALAFEPIAVRARKLESLEFPPLIGEEQGGAVLEVVGRPPVRNPVPASTREAALAKHPFLKWDDAFEGFEVPAGVHEVQGALVLPEGAGLRLGPGTTLRFGESGLLVASGPLEWAGTAEKPVVLEGRSEGAGGRRGWQGVVVLQSSRPHELTHVEVRGTTGVSRPGWSLTGGFTIRASTAALNHIRIVGSRAEDALNLIRARFDLREIEVVDTRSDGIDADFSAGSIDGGRFAGIGGDAIDVSGADVELVSVSIENVHDKAISVGERSFLRARKVTIDSVGTAVASKDGSRVVIEDSQIRRVTHAALMAYAKKSGYGPAELEAKDVVLDRIGRPALAQLGSRVVIDGAVQAAEEIDIGALYKRGYMEK